MEDLELRRQDENFLNALGAERIPDPTTAGDFTRRFGPEDIEGMQECINRARRAVWEVPHLHVQTDEVKDFELGGTEVAVTVTAGEYLKEKEATRPSTIR